MTGVRKRKCDRGSASYAGETHVNLRRCRKKGILSDAKTAYIRAFRSPNCDRALHGRERGTQTVGGKRNVLWVRSTTGCLTVLKKVPGVQEKVHRTLKGKGSEVRTVASEGARKIFGSGGEDGKNIAS